MQSSSNKVNKISSKNSSSPCTKEYITCSYIVQILTLVNNLAILTVAKKVTLFISLHFSYTNNTHFIPNSLLRVDSLTVKQSLSTNHTGPTTTTTYLITKGREQKTYTSQNIKMYTIGAS